MPFATVGGHRFYYEVGGEGETVLLLHGSFADGDLLEGPATAISSGFRALRFDRRGHGRSSDAPEPLSLADEAAEMAALLDWFSTEKAHLLAHDDGAEVAIQFALDFPARTLSLALLAPTLEGFPWKDETRAARHALLSAFARSPRAAIEEEWLPLPAFDVARALEGPFERLQTVVLVGDREDSERLVCAATIVQGIHGAEGTTIAGASRFLHMEDPRHVMRRLTDFYIPPEE